MKDQIIHIIKLGVLIFVGYTGIAMVDVGNDHQSGILIGFGLSMTFACFAYCGILVERYKGN